MNHYVVSTMIPWMLTLHDELSGKNNDNEESRREWCYIAYILHYIYIYMYICKNPRNDEHPGLRVHR